MATEKELKLIISEEGGDTVKKQIKEIKIEAISAKKLMQDVVDGIPSATEKAKTSLDEFSKKVKSMSHSLNKHYTTADELYKTFLGTASSNALTERMTKLTGEAAQLTLTMEQIQNLNEKVHKSLEQSATAKLTANKAELDGLAKNAKSLEQLMEKYEERKKLLADQAEFAKAAANTEYEEMKKVGANAVLMEQQKADKIKDIETKLAESQKQNAKSYESAAKAFRDRLFDSFTEKMEVTVDKSAKNTEKLLKNTEGAAKKMAEEIRENFGLTEGALDDIAIAAMQAQVKSKAATAEAATTAEATAKAAEAATKTSEAAAKTADTTVKTTEAATKTVEAAKKTAENTKKIIDIDGTWKNIKLAKEGLDYYRTALYDAYSKYIEAYNKNLEAAKGNAEEIKKLEKEKADVTKFYVEEIIKTNQTLTAAEKKQQDLSMVQWKQHLENMNQLFTNFAGNMKKTMNSVGDYFSIGLSAVSDVYKAEITAIDEDIKHLQKKNAEFLKEQANQTAEKAAITEQYNAKKRELMNQGLSEEEAEGTAELKAIKDKETEAQKILDDSLAKKQEIDKKERDLQAEKAKTQAKQEKIEKLNRKATLIKNIGDATANVAQGVTKALAFGPILGPVLAAVVAAAGAIQIGIMTKQLAKFENGGLLKGKRHTQGGMRIEGTNIEVEGGEYVVNRVSTDKNIGLIRYINSQRREVSSADVSAFFSRSSQGFEPPFSRAFEAGGQLPAIDNPGSVDNESLVEAIRAIRIEPRVSVTDIDRVRNEMVSVDGWVGL